MTRKNQFELVTASFNNQEEPVSASHSQFQWKEKPVWASYQFQQPDLVSASHRRTSFNDKTKTGLS